MTRLTSLAQLFSAWMLVGCQHAASEHSWIFVDELRGAMGARAQALRVARSPLLLDSGLSVTDCSQYIAARRAGAGVSEQVDARMVASEYLVCDALCATAEARPVRSAAAARGRALATRLNLRSFDSSLGPRLPEGGPTLQALPGQLRTDDTTATLDSDGWHVSLAIVAEADLDRDGDIDWLVWLTDEATTSNYRTYHTLIVPNATASGPLHAMALWAAP
jgi:hypothetical protein